MLSTEDQVRELLQQTPPESSGINFYQLQRAVHRAQRTRSIRRILAVTSVVAIAAAVGLIATHTDSPGAASQQLTDGPRFPVPAIIFSGPATASGILEGGTRFTPPHDPASAIPAPVALQDTWTNWRHDSVPLGATKVRVILAHLSRVGVTHPQDDWLLVFYGGCMYVPVPPPAITKHSSSSHTGCQDIPYTDVINARTGHWLFSFGGGTSDPAKLLTPTS